jgi:hypothetical protein
MRAVARFKSIQAGTKRTQSQDTPRGAEIGPPVKLVKTRSLLLTVEADHRLEVERYLLHRVNQISRCAGCHVFRRTAGARGGANAAHGSDCAATISGLPQANTPQPAIMQQHARQSSASHQGRRMATDSQHELSQCGSVEA